MPQQELLKCNSKLLPINNYFKYKWINSQPKEIGWLKGFFFIFCLFRVTPTAYVGSQSRGQIGAVAASLPTATAMPDP